MPGPKLNNRRVFPKATRQPFQKDDFRKQEAKERQEAYDKLSTKEKLDRMPPEPHAKKQRARLLALLEQEKKPKVEVKPTDKKTQETNQKKGK